MNEINQTQNSSSSIDKIGAFRQAYKSAKLLGRIQITLVVIAFLITLLSVILNSPETAALLYTNQRDISHIVLICTMLIALFEISYLKPNAAEKIELGAKIQELFDTEVFRLPWNSVCAGKKPAVEKINALARKHFKKNTDTQPLQNWYSVRPSTPHYLAILVCQYSSLSWDIELREKIKQAVILISLTLTLIIALTAALLNLDTKSTLLNLTSIVIPIFAYGYTVFEMNNKTIKHTKEVKDLISDTIDSVSPSADIDQIMQLCRQIQDRIYTYRAEAWPIPEWFYWILRNEFESTMAYSAADIQNRLITQSTR